MKKVNEKKNYRIVNGKEDEDFAEMYKGAWKKLGIDDDQFDDAISVVVEDEKGKAIATVEFLKYDKGQESDILENVYPFKQVQGDNKQVVYLDKVVIKEEERGKIESMYYLMQAIWGVMDEIKEKDKERVVIALVRKRFFRYLKRMLTFDIVQLGEEINEEIPMMIEIDTIENFKKIQEGTWAKIKF